MDSQQLLTFENISYSGPIDIDYPAYEGVYTPEEFSVICSKWAFTNGLEEAILYLKGIIDDILTDGEPNISGSSENNTQKIFISHSSEDKKIVSEIVELLSLIGVKDSSIFCTSLEGYRIPLGKDWLKELKARISGNVLVLFVISDNYFKSPVSLSEMGAAWALSKESIPILIPPMDYSKMKSVIPLTQGFKINETHKWTELKTKLESSFKLPPRSYVIWEDKKKQILKRIAKNLTL